jgi:hypothetical protein
MLSSSVWEIPRLPHYSNCTLTNVRLHRVFSGTPGWTVPSPRGQISTASTAIAVPRQDSLKRSAAPVLAKKGAGDLRIANIRLDPDCMTPIAPVLPREGSRIVNNHRDPAKLFHTASGVRVSS